MSKKKDILGYEEADKGFLVHEGDSVLKPIWIPLPEPPTEKKRITNYGLPPAQQFFQREVYPTGLKIMEQEVLNRIEEENSRVKLKIHATVNDFWSELMSDTDKYQEEINWIKSQWYYRLNGKWFYIKGKPYYVCGWHWMYLNYYKQQSGFLPDYWYKDWKWFNAVIFLYHEKATVGGKEIYANDGINSVDGRRTGKTSKAASIELDLSSISQHFKGGIQGKDGDNSGDLFKEHIVMPFRYFPWFFKPETAGSTDPSEVLYFKNTAVRSGGRGTVVTQESGLESKIDFAGTQDEKKYDGKTLNYFINDEAGKLKKDVRSRHEVLRPCVRQGLNRVGFMVYATTVEETESDRRSNTNITESIVRFYEHCKKSFYHERGEDGMTTNGMVNLYFPASEAYEGCIDKWGFPEKEKAEQMILGRRKRYLDKGDYRGLAQITRKHSLDFSECFIPDADDEYFDAKILQKGLNILQSIPPPIIQGNFVRKTPDPESDVVFIPNENGKWIVSMRNLEHYGIKPNNKRKVNGKWRPIDPQFIISADPFRHNKTTTRGHGVSDGGGAVFWMHDEKRDPFTKDITEWVTYNFVATYQFRPKGTATVTPKEEYAEDMLMACEFYNAWMYPENNIKDIEEYFLKRDRDDYLLYDVKKTPSGISKSEKAGFNTSSPEVKDDLFKGLSGFISLHGLRIKHAEILRDCMQIRGLDDMTNFDRFTACCGCLKGITSMQIDMVKSTSNVQKQFSRQQVFGM